MKKLLFVAAILLFVSSCANDDDTVIQLENSDLQGDWSMTSETDVENETWKVTYTFSLSGGFEAVTAYKNQESNALIGYGYKREGSYSFKQDSIIINTEKEFVVPGDSDYYVEDSSELEERDVFYSNTMGYSLTENRSKLTLKYKPCGPLENCVAETILFKE